MDKMHKHLVSESALSPEIIDMQHKAYLGDAEAQYSLADIFQKGRGTARNSTNAFYWYERSAKQGNIEAQFNVWYAYLIGDGVEANLEKSDFWYRIASVNNINVNGHSVVQKLLGAL